MMRRKRFSLGGVENIGDSINLTPMIDVLLVTLILFILIAPLIDLDHVQLAPKGSQVEELAELNPNRPLKIFVHRDDSIWLGKHLLSLEALESTLIELGKIHPNEIPELYCDEKCSFGTYQRIKNAIEEAGFEQLDVILKRE